MSHTSQQRRLARERRAYRPPATGTAPKTSWWADAPTRAKFNEEQKDAQKRMQGAPSTANTHHAGRPSGSRP